MYNISVANDAVYYAGDARVLVHNAIRCHVAAALDVDTAIGDYASLRRATRHDDLITTELPVYTDAMKPSGGFGAHVKRTQTDEWLAS